MTDELTVVRKAIGPDGKEFLLYHKDDEYIIRVDGSLLMTSECSGSEKSIARLACSSLDFHDGVRVLIGGLGMGYTLRAVLDLVPADALVEVAELIPAIVEWNRGPLSNLTHDVLDDCRVRLYVGDVADAIEIAQVSYDAIILDVDNGPEALSCKTNFWLYSNEGLSRLWKVLAADGVLVVWSAFYDEVFRNRMEKIGFCVDVRELRAENVGPNGEFYIFLGKKS